MNEAQVLEIVKSTISSVAIENLLVRKGIISSKELSDEKMLIAKKIVTDVLTSSGKTKEEISTLIQKVAG